MQADPEVMRLLLAIAVFIIILAPGSAGAATYVFDEPSGSLVVTASASDDAVRVASNFETGELQVCGDEDPDGNCIDWPTAHHVTLNLTEDVELGVFTEALHPPSGSVDITVTGTSSSVVRLYCSIDATRDCAITGSGTTLDTNSDSIPDITFTGPRIRTLNILTGAGNDTINLTKFTTPLAKPKPGRNFQISMKTGAGNDTVHTGPTNDGVYLATGNDTANLGAGNNAASGTSGTKNITTGPGNDTITDNTATKKTQATTPSTQAQATITFKLSTATCE